MKSIESICLKIIFIPIILIVANQSPKHRNRFGQPWPITTDHKSNAIGSQDDIVTTTTEPNGLFENFVEGYVKDLFTKELSTAKTNNLTDCMTRLLCERICQRTVSGEIKGEPLLNSAEMLGRTENDPLGYFFTGGDRGYEFGKRNQCHRCSQRYGNCLNDQYDLTRTMSDNYERQMLNGAESSIDTDIIGI